MAFIAIIDVVVVFVVVIFSLLLLLGKILGHLNMSAWKLLEAFVLVIDVDIVVVAYVIIVQEDARSAEHECMEFTRSSASCGSGQYSIGCP